MFRLATSINRVASITPHRCVASAAFHRPIMTTNIRGFSSIPHSSSTFSQHQQYQQHQQHHQHQQHQQHHKSSWSSSSRSSSSSSSSRIILFSSTAALVAATGLTMHNSSHVHAAPLTHNHPHNPIILTTPKDLPTEVIGADLVVASRWRRVLARMLDSIIQGLICQVGTLILPQYNAVALIVSLGYEILLNMYNDGQTVGKMIVRVRTVKESGDSLDFRASFLNWFGFAFFTMLFGINALWGLFNFSGDYKCLHNVISGTIVVDTDSLAQEEKHAAVARWRHHQVDVEMEEEDDD